jgi:glycosyltransferase involved in cell wall biosynthesis
MATGRDLGDAPGSRTDRADRLSICYVAPGHDLLPSAGPTRNVLAMAEALASHARVAVAFRSVAEPIAHRGYDVLEIQPGRPRSPGRADDAAVRGMGLLEFAGYLAAVRRFADERLRHYDVVLEKSWLLSGHVAARCRRWGIPAIVVENLVRVWNEPVRTPGALLRLLRFRLTQTLVGRSLRRTGLIIAETDELQAALSERFRIPRDRIRVAGLGVDRRLFRPAGQLSARRRLGISAAPLVLLYAGALDRFHPLGPVLDAVAAAPEGWLELHVVGDGVLKPGYERAAAAGRAPVVFHGRVEHEAVPRYIAAADLCLAPYDPAAFPNGRVGYASLKIAEYMACARPVAGVASGHVCHLIEPGVTGFLVANEASAWARLLEGLPSRARLLDMGAAAARSATLVSWDEAAGGYLRACHDLLGRARAAQTGLAASRRESWNDSW